MTSQKGFTPIFILVGIVLIVGLVGGAYYLKSRGTPLYKQGTNTNPNIDYNTSGAANLKLYKNKKFAFSFKYPSDFFKYLTDEFSDDTTLQFTLSPEEIMEDGTSKNGGLPAITLSVQIYQYKDDLNTFIKKTSNMDYFKTATKELFNKGVISGVKFTRFRQPLDVPGGYSYRVFIKHGPFMYHFNLLTHEEELLLENKKRLDSIIDTLEFIDSSKIGDWKKYTSQAFKLSFKYPPDWTVVYDTSLENKPLSGDGQGQSNYDAKNYGRVVLDVGTQAGATFCEGKCKTPLTEQWFFDTGQWFWQRRQEGYGGYYCPWTQKVYQSWVGVKKAMVKETIKVCKQEIGGANIRYFIYQNIPGEELLVFNLYFYDGNPDKEQILETFKEILESVQFYDSVKE